MADAETLEANVYFERGVQFYNSGNYKDALSNLNQAIFLADASASFLPKAHLYRGMIFDYVHHNGYAAVMDYHAYLKQTSANRSKVLALFAEAAFNQGIIYRRLLNSSVNIDRDHYTYLLTLAKEPQSSFVTKDNLPYLHYFRGVCWFLAGRFSEAMTDFKEVPPGTPVSSLAKVRFATCLYLIGRQQEADKRFTEIDLKHPLLMTEFYRAYADCGKPMDPQAVSACEKAFFSLKEKSAQKQGRVNLGLIYLSRGETEKALAQVASLEPIPDFSPSFAIVFRGETKPFSAEYYDPSIYYLKQRIFFEVAKGAYAELKTDPVKFGRCLLYMGKTDAAKAVFEGVDDPIATIHLGIAQKLLGDEKGAKATQDRLPQSPKFMELLDYHLAEYGFLKESRRRETTLSAGQSGYLFLQKGIYEKSEKRSDWLTVAAEQFEASIAKSGGDVYCDPLLLIGLFDAHYHNRHFSIAGAIAETLSIRYPDGVALKSALNIISEIQKVWPLGQMPLPHWSTIP